MVCDKALNPLKAETEHLLKPIAAGRADCYTRENDRF